MEIQTAGLQDSKSRAALPDLMAAASAADPKPHSYTLDLIDPTKPRQNLEPSSVRLMSFSLVAFINSNEHYQTGAGRAGGKMGRVRKAWAPIGSCINTGAGGGRAGRAGRVG